MSRLEVLRKLTQFDFAHKSVDERDRMKIVPTASTENFNKLVEEHNKLIDFVNFLVNHTPSLRWILDAQEKSNER